VISCRITWQGLRSASIGRTKVLCSHSNLIKALHRTFCTIDCRSLLFEALSTNYVEIDWVQNGALILLLVNCDSYLTFDVCSLQSRREILGRSHQSPAIAKEKISRIVANLSKNTLLIQQLQVNTAPEDLTLEVKRQPRVCKIIRRLVNVSLTS